MKKSTAKYRVGLIGAGRAGVPRARAFDMHPLCEVVAIADTDADNLALASKRFGAPGYKTWDEMFAKERIDISMPILPVRPNADAIIASARAGVKAIFCEKPLTGSLEAADRLIAETKSRNIPVACGVVVSGSPDYQKAYELAASGEIGKVLRINIYDDNGQVGTHALHIARRFADKSDVDHVIGWVSGDPSAESEDDHGEGKPGYGAIGGYVRFKNGIEVFSSYGGPKWMATEVIGTKGVIFNENNTALGLRMFRARPGVEPKSWADL